MSAGVFGGPHIAHHRNPIFAAYVDGECVVAGTARQVAKRMGVKPSAVYCGVSPSRAGKRKRVEYVRFYEEDEHED